MPIDASIYGQFAPKVNSIQDLAEADARQNLQSMQIYGQQRQNMLADMQAQQTLAKLQQARAMRDAVQGGKIDLSNPQHWGNALSQFPDVAPTAIDAIVKGQKDSAAAAKDVAGADEIRHKIRLADRMSAIQRIGAFDTPDQVAAYLNSQEAIGINDNERTQLLRAIPTDPAQLQLWQARTVLQLAAPEKQSAEMLPKYQAAGGALVNTNPLAGAVGQGQPNAIPITMKPAEVSEAANRDLVSDGQGGWKVNKPLVDAKAQIAAAGATRQQTNINSYTPASEAAQSEFMKGVRTRFDQLQSAPALLDNIEKAKALVPSAKGFMGPGGDSLLSAAKFLNNRLGAGINTEGVKSAEELRSRMFIQVMENLKKMDAQPSQYQQIVMQDAFGTLGTDPTAVPKILDVFGDIVRQKVDIHNREVAGAERKGVKFPYDPMITLPGAKSSTQSATPASDGWGEPKRVK